ncbi:MAG: GNAT family N-acetyltransferase [Erysipelotrichaceae bacterium]|nr:GNAT family N-acetyltransferase [Erysipelotrichaceae bacterium]
MIDIRQYTYFNEKEIRELYDSAGWSAYTADMDTLRQGFEHSLLVMASYDEKGLTGIIRAVGDGATVILIQDLVVRKDSRRSGIGSALVMAIMKRFDNVRQVLLFTDDTPENRAFYQSVGFRNCREADCVGYMIFRR